MAKKVKQFRYYEDGSIKNQPSGLTMDNLFSGNIFSNCAPIYQLGIQSLPGTKFYLNDSDNPVVLNASGIYELEANGSGQVVSLSFDKTSLESIHNSGSGYLIVDILYKQEE